MPENDTIIEHLFRRKYGEMLSVLLRKFGNEKFDLAEESIQHAFQKAIEKWSYTGVPDNPSAWLYTVAQNSLLDTLKRDKTGEQKIEQFKYEQISDSKLIPELNEAEFDENESDDLMKMVFLCCNPDINPKAQICITLKAACGFTVAEISRALGMSAESVKKIITRAKSKIAGETNPLTALNSYRIADRFPLVIEVIYAMFTEGYSASSGELSLRREIAEEAIYLGGVILNSKYTPEESKGDLSALIALMLFQFSRFEERIDGEGIPKRLQEQDRSKWDSEMIAAGFLALEDSKKSDLPSVYHLEARIAAAHSSGKSFKETDWDKINSLYDELLKLKDTVSVRMNRIVAILYTKGPELALNEINDLMKSLKPVSGHILNQSYHLNALHAEILETVGDEQNALLLWKSALKLSPTSADKKFIESKINNLNNRQTAF
jgi:RNA polymerase sigma-70 factor (ECF subfamily)